LQKKHLSLIEIIFREIHWREIEEGERERQSSENPHENR
jgi:hypothetical protein